MSVNKFFCFFFLNSFKHNKFLSRLISHTQSIVLVKHKFSNQNSVRHVRVVDNWRQKTTTRTDGFLLKRHFVFVSVKENKKNLE